MVFKCKKDCSECCGPVPFPKETYEKHLNKIEGKVFEKLELGNEFVLITPDMKCVFLKDNKCNIYDNRPIVCKNYGIDERLLCAYVKSNGNPRSPAMVKRFQRKINKDINNVFNLIKK